MLIGRIRVLEKPIEFSPMSGIDGKAAEGACIQSAGDGFVGSDAIKIKQSKTDRRVGILPYGGRVACGSGSIPPGGKNQIGLPDFKAVTRTATQAAKVLRRSSANNHSHSVGLPVRITRMLKNNLVGREAAFKG